MCVFVLINCVYLQHFPMYKYFNTEDTQTKQHRSTVVCVAHKRNRNRAILRNRDQNTFLHSAFFRLYITRTLRVYRESQVGAAFTLSETIYFFFCRLFDIWLDYFVIIYTPRIHISEKWIRKERKENQNKYTASCRMWNVDWMIATHCHFVYFAIAKQIIYSIENPLYFRSFAKKKLPIRNECWVRYITISANTF